MSESAALAQAHAQDQARAWCTDLSAALDSLTDAAYGLATDVGFLRSSIAEASPGLPAVVDRPSSTPAPDTGTRRGAWPLDRPIDAPAAAREPAGLAEGMARALDELEEQLEGITRRRDAVEERLRQLRAALLAQQGGQRVRR
jgi:hypothetical protein